MQLGQRLIGCPAHQQCHLDLDQSILGFGRDVEDKGSRQHHVHGHLGGLRLGLCLLALRLTTAFALGLLFTGRPLPCAISGVLMGVLLYGLFDYLLDVPLPLGLFEAFVES